MEKTTFGKTNYILIAVGMAIIILGFLLMSGSGSTFEKFNPDIFSARRIKIAPIVCFIGFASMVYGIMHKPKDSDTEETTLDNKGQEYQK